MATAIVPYQPERNTDPSLTNNDVLWKTGALKEPLVHYSQESRILSETVYNNAGVNGALVSPSIFGGRTIFSGATSGNWQLPLATALLQEMRSVYGDFAQKLNHQSFEVKADFINSSPNTITITTNTGLTLQPSPITIPSLSNVVLIFEVVGSTFGTASILVRVEGSGGAANAPNDIVVAATGGLISTLAGNTYTVSPDLAQSYSYTATGPVLYNDTTNTLSTFSTWDQRAVGGTLSGPANITNVMTNIVYGTSVTTPWFTYNGTTGVITWTVAQNISISASVVITGNQALTGGTPTASAPATPLFMIFSQNGGTIATYISDTGAVEGNLDNYPVEAGTTMQVQIGTTAGTIGIITASSYLHFGTMSG